MSNNLIQDHAYKHGESDKRIKTNLLEESLKNWNIQYFAHKNYESTMLLTDLLKNLNNIYTTSQKRRFAKNKELPFISAEIRLTPELIILYIYSCFSELKLELDLVKLNRILWFSDSQSLIENSMTITGEYDYKVKENGLILPVLPKFIKNIRNLKNIDNTNESEKYETTENHLPIKISIFGRDILDFWIDYVSNNDIETINNVIKKYNWWKHTLEGQPIPVHLGAREAVLVQKWIQ